MCSFNRGWSPESNEIFYSLPTFILKTSFQLLIQQDLKQLTSYLVPPRLISQSLAPMILPTSIILFQHQQTETDLAQPIFYSSIIVRGPDHNNIYPDSSHWKSCNIRSTLVALWPLEKPLLYWLVNLRITKHFVLVRVRWGLNINLIIISITFIPQLLATPPVRHIRLTPALKDTSDAIIQEFTHQ